MNMASNWNMCSETWEGKPCKNRARYPGGSKCCTCFNRATRAKDPEKVAKFCKNYFENNKEKCRENQRKYYQKNIEIERLRAAIYRHKNEDKIREYNKNVYNPRRREQRKASRAILAKGLPLVESG